MKHKPYGEDYMVGAWMDFLFFLYRQEWARNEFKTETGIDIRGVLLSGGINKMIDEATGFTRDAVIKWADWVTLNHWGVEENA